MWQKCKDLQEYLVNVRRQLHQIPELGNDLPETRAFVCAELDKMGIPYKLNTLDSGIVALIEGGKPGKVVALRADMRIMLTGFSAEETLTSDLVPVNMDAAVFWMVWDAEKVCLEVENYYDAVSMAAQTALRDAIGRKNISDVTVHRDKLDQELKDKIEEKSSTWGISILSVEIRDIVIPKELQCDMAAAAKAEREKDARIVLAEVERDVAEMLLDATEVYRKDEMAFELRSMHLLSEGVKKSNGTLVIPSAYSEGFRRGRGSLPTNDGPAPDRDMDA